MTTPAKSILHSSSHSEIFSAVMKTPFGALGIRSGAGIVQEFVFLPAHFAATPATDAAAEQACRQIERYLHAPDYRFDLPLAVVGTHFQQRVWAAIAAVPRGHTTTYGAIAKILRTAPRAVGQACGANWFPLVIPCHRVTAMGGLGGFAHHDDTGGFHLGVKRWLLAHEGAAHA